MREVGERGFNERGAEKAGGMALDTETGEAEEEMAGRVGQ
jgi:hypothetical protein